MPRYKTRVTPEAKADLKEAVLYIAKKLAAPKAAQALRQAIHEAVTGLKTNPEIFPLVQDDYLAAQGIRWLGVKNQMVFYTVEHAVKTVVVVRVLYAGRDWSGILKATYHR